MTAIITQKSRISNPDYTALNGLEQHKNATTIWDQFRSLTEKVLAAAQADAKDAFLHLGEDESTDKFGYANKVVGACRRALDAEIPEDIDCDDKETIHNAVWAFI